MLQVASTIVFASTAPAPSVFAVAGLLAMVACGLLYSRFTEPEVTPGHAERGRETVKMPVVHGDSLMGGYLLLEELSSSPHSATYRASKDPSNQEEEVFVRVIRPRGADPDSWRNRFLRAIKTAQELKGDLVPPLLDWGEKRGVLYAVRPLLQSRPMPGGKEVSPERILGPFPRLFREMHEYHLRNLVHRNLKTSKIRLEPSGRARLTDFGLLGGPGYGALTGSGEWVGTPAYLAPEQLRDDPVTASADQYALGVILYELLTGDLPLVGPNESGLMLRKQVEQPAPPSSLRPEIDAGLDEIVMRMLAPEPTQRYPDLSMTADALEQWLRPDEESDG